MRLLVAEGAGLAPRLERAALALARRGHLVHWFGRSAARHATRVPGVRPVRRRFDVAGLDVDAVVADAAHPAGAALLAWLARAGVLMLDVRAARLARWNALDHWAWGMAYSVALVTPDDAEAVRGGPHGLPLDRFGLWPDAESDAEDPAGDDAEVLERALERALARRRGRAPRPAAFFDRDGTLIVERGYLSDPADVELVPGAAEALRELRAGGYALVVVSNQSGVGRGYFTAGDVHAAMARLREVLRAEGVELDAIYFCPHAPEAGCACRKPGTALLERASEDLVLDLTRSVMTGDKRIDAECGQRAGGRGLLLRSGYGREEEQRAAGSEGLAPDAVCDDLAAAAAWMLDALAARSRD